MNKEIKVWIDFIRKLFQSFVLELHDQLQTMIYEKVKLIGENEGNVEEIGLFRKSLR